MTSEKLKNCPRCGKLYFVDDPVPHRCQHYEIICDEIDEEQIYEIYASNIESAIERWAERLDSDEPYIISFGGDNIVRVRARGGEAKHWSCWHVTGRWVPQYEAMEIP